MKKKLLFAAAAIVAASLFAAPTAFAGVKTSKTVKTERRPVSSDYTSVEVFHAVKVIVEERLTGDAVITAPEDILPYIYAEVSDGKLRIGLMNMKRLPRQQLSDIGEMTITVPYSGDIRALDVSGASSLTVKPRLRAGNLDIVLSGAARLLGVDILASKCSADVSGASSMLCDIEGGTLVLDFGGASSFSGTVRAVSLDVEASGASKLKLSGSASRTGISASGASGVDASEMSTAVCSVDASGASKVSVHCAKSLSAKASGSSVVKYEGGCALASSSTSGAGKILKINK